MFFKIRHQLYPVYQTIKLSFSPIFPVVIDSSSTYEIRVLAFSGIRTYNLDASVPGQVPDMGAAKAFINQPLSLSVQGQLLSYEMVFPQEGSYYIDLLVNGKQVERFEVYALGDDLYHRTPLKGDQHMHSIGSDGENSPAYMAAMSCKRGCDYITLTDHWYYEPSLEAQQIIQKVTHAFFVIPGEEVHAPNNHVHILNIGGTASVNAWYRDHRDEYDLAVEKEKQEVPSTICEKDRTAIASCQAVFDRIKSVDGIPVLAHPHWIVENGFQESEDITNYLFDHRRFEVLELIAGGAFEVGTQLQISYYQEKPKMPIVGDSDAHQAGSGFLAPINYSIVFAKESSVEGVKEAIRNGWSIGGYENKLFGDFRLLKYAYFLQRTLMPAHDSRAYDIGVNLIKYVSGNCSPDFPDLPYLQSIDSPSSIFEQSKFKS